MTSNSIPTDANRPSNPIEPWMLSAYALGELEPEDAARVSQALIANPALKGELKQIQQTIGAVQSVLQETEPVVGLKADQSSRVFASILASEPQKTRDIASASAMVSRSTSCGPACGCCNCPACHGDRA